MTRERAAVVDPDRLRSASRPGDGFYSTFAVRPVSRRVTARALRLGLRPNEVTAVSLLLGLTAAVLFTRPGWSTVAAALLLQASLVADCVDGEIARYTRTFTPSGAWLDGVGDRVKEYAAYAGLAVAADSWALAGATLALTVFRHVVDFGFAVRQTAPASSAAGDSARSSAAELGDRAAALSERTNRSSRLVWAKRVVIMPIGERWLVISVVSVVAGARAVFVTLLVLGAVAATYTTVGRVLRSFAGSLHALPTPPLWALAGLPWPRGAARAPARLSWLLPSLVRGGEAAVVVGTTSALAPQALPAAYALAAASAFDAYDCAYRWSKAQALPGARRALVSLTSPGRAAVAVALLATASARSASHVMVGLALWVVALVVLDVQGWLRGGTA